MSLPPFLYTTKRHVVQVLQLAPLPVFPFVQIIAFPSGDFHFVRKPMDEQYLRAFASALGIGAGAGFGFGFGFALGWQ
jgi:hypothetical protein